MSFKIDKIIEFIKKRRELFLVILFVLIVILVIVYVLVSRKKEEEIAQSYVETTLSGQKGEGSLAVSGVNLEDPDDYDPEKTYTIYEFETYNLGRVKQILRSLGIGTLNEEVYDDDTLYIWRPDENTYARYSTVNGSFVISSESIKLSQLESNYVSVNTAEQYLKDFVEVYIGVDLDPVVTVENEGNDYRVVGDWEINGYQLYSGINYTGSINVIFSEDGELVNLSMDLIEVSSTNREVSVVGASDMEAYLSLSNYPKDVFITELQDENPECEDYDCLSNFTVSRILTLDIDEFKLAYHFNPINSEDIAPIYFISGEGEVMDTMAKTHDVAMVVFANAVDPERLLLGED